MLSNNLQSLDRLQQIIEQLQSELDEARNLLYQIKEQESICSEAESEDSPVDVMMASEAVDATEPFSQPVENQAYFETSTQIESEEEKPAIDLDIIDISDNEQSPSVDEPVIFEMPAEAQTEPAGQPVTVLNPSSECSPQPFFQSVSDEPVKFDQPSPKLAFVDAMLSKEAWKTDIPGSRVNDVRSAIALNDRILFINTLFNGDAEAFQKTISAVNQMTCLEEAIEYVEVYFPDWDMSSDTVYRFMMAIRRRVN